MKEAVNKLKLLINDLTTLEVSTISGTLNISELIVEKNEKKTINFQKILEKISGDATEDSKISLIASTKIDFDSDVQLFVKSNPSESELKLIDLHKETVKVAMEARRSAIEALLSIATGT